ncbi:MAG: DUF84 family protein [Clostridia bacterium]|nr:DUF84 family protein [Clostridia bacterium]
MYISIGTRSKPKISAVCAAFAMYPQICFAREDELHFVILPEEKRGEAKGADHVDQVSGVSCNPMTLESTILGAKNRAREAYAHCLDAHGECAFGVGIEAGLFPAEGVQTGYLDTSICAIYNGKEYFVGGSPLFEYPAAVVRRIKAGEEAGLISDFFGDFAKGRSGVIGPLSGGIVNRDEFDRYAVLMALTRVAAAELYAKDENA